jgi:hypothetical protein
MGYMTPILFLNDAYGDIEKNPEQVVQNILRAMNGAAGRWEYFGVGSFANPMKPLRTQHADVPRLMLAHQNTITELGHGSELEERMDLIAYRKQNLVIAKQIIKDEERLIKEMEAKKAAGA